MLGIVIPASQVRDVKQRKVVSIAEQVGELILKGRFDDVQSSFV